MSILSTFDNRLILVEGIFLNLFLGGLAFRVPLLQEVILHSRIWFIVSFESFLALTKIISNITQ